MVALLVRVLPGCDKGEVQADHLPSSRRQAVQAIEHPEPAARRAATTRLGEVGTMMDAKQFESRPLAKLAKIASQPKEFHMRVTATQARNQFDAICAHAKTEPIFVEKGGRIDTVIVSIQQFEALKSSAQSRTLAQRQAQFEKAYPAWIAEQKARFETHGLWCDELRVW